MQDEKRRSDSEEKNIREGCHLQWWRNARRENNNARVYLRICTRHAFYASKEWKQEKWKVRWNPEGKVGSLFVGFCSRFSSPLSLFCRHLFSVSRLAVSQMIYFPQLSLRFRHLSLLLFTNENFKDMNEATERMTWSSGVGARDISHIIENMSV